jgi:hypothetical protein
MYFEWWESVDIESETWRLDRAYLSLYYIDRTLRKDVEVLAVHCDPDEPADQPHSKYKRGPHVHVTWAKDPMPRAHLALNVAHLDDVLASAGALTAAIGVAVDMVRDEVLSLAW